MFDCLTPFLVFIWGTHSALGGAPGEAADDDQAGKMLYNINGEYKAAIEADSIIRNQALGAGVLITGTSYNVQGWPVK